jgi:hypothetical protein
MEPMGRRRLKKRGGGLVLMLLQIIVFILETLGQYESQNNEANDEIDVGWDEVKRQRIWKSGRDAITFVSCLLQPHRDTILVCETE